jgi:ABC-type dipeptide/oligopeptide/nickel transport system permease subunit
MNESDSLELTGPPRSPWGDAVREFRRNKAGLFGLAVLVLIVVLAVAAPFVAPHDPNQQSLGDRLSPGFWAGNATYPLGTDDLGRDVLSRVIYGSRVSMAVGFIAVGITIVVGMTLGALSGYYGGITDLVGQRAVDLMLIFPDLVLALVIIAILGPGLGKAMIAIGIVYVPRMTRLVRGSVLSVKESTFVDAARALGAPSGRIIRAHILPNVIGPAIVYLSLLLGDAILYAAALGFLGMGAQPPTAEWGAMLSKGRDFIILGKWWYATFPGVAIALTVVCLNLVGDALRDALDPQLRKY